MGGGIREAGDVEEILEAGADRLIVGTVFARAPDSVADWIARYGRIFIAGIDARDGMVKVSGWEKDSGVTGQALASKAKDIGIMSIVYTNIKRDGTLAGPDVSGSDEIGRSAALPVIVSGGVGGMADLQQVYDYRSDWIVGVITGKAVYEGLVDIGEAVRRFSGSGESAAVQRW